MARSFTSTSRTANAAGATVLTYEKGSGPGPQVTMDTLELLLHPIRIRIVNAFSGDRSRTTSEVCRRLPDVSQATVYRHVALLAEAEVLVVVDEQVVRGAVERHYRLDRELAGSTRRLPRR